MDVLPAQYSGGTVRISNIFKRLQRNHRIYFVYIGKDEIKAEHSEMFKEFCVSIDRIALEKKQSFWGRILNILQLKHGAYAKNRFKADYCRVKEELEEFIRKNKIDSIHVFTYFSAQYVEDIKNVIKIWDVADSYSLEMKRRIKNKPLFSKANLFFEVLRLFNYEKEMIDKFSATIFVSHIDANIYSRMTAKDKIYVIPNGVDLEYFKPQNEIIEDYPSLIFTGHMSFIPNIDAVKYFVQKIYPLIRKEIPQAKLYIVGADVSQDVKSLNNRDNIVVTGMVDDIRPYLAKATVFINPMISGVGIKNKVLQAMAMGKAIVSTRLGAESISVTDNNDILLADEPSEFADKVITLIKDAGLRVSLGKCARKTIESKYSWENTSLAYERMYDSLHKEITQNRESLKMNLLGL